MPTPLFSGSTNIDGTLKIRATKLYENSTASQILEAVENAQENKAKSEKFITKFARIYTPVVVGLAVMLAVIPSCITGNWGEWIHRALLFWWFLVLVRLLCQSHYHSSRALVARQSKAF